GRHALAVDPHHVAVFVTGRLIAAVQVVVEHGSDVQTLGLVGVGLVFAPQQTLLLAFHRHEFDGGGELIAGQGAGALHRDDGPAGVIIRPGGVQLEIGGNRIVMPADDKNTLVVGVGARQGGDHVAHGLILGYTALLGNLERVNADLQPS